jgi:membrane fusion protein
MTNNSNNLPTPLFRQEVFDAKQQDRLGAIVLTPHVSFYLIALVATIIAVLLLAFLYFGSYTRRITVSGQLVPISGLIRVLPPQPGVVLEKHVVEGQKVRQGDVLYVLNSDRVGLSSHELQADISAQIAKRKSSMQSEISRNKNAEQQEMALLRQRQAFLRNEVQAIQTQSEQQKQRVALAQDAYNRYLGLADKDYIAHEQLVQKQMELSEQQTRLQVLQRDLLTNQREQAATQREISDTQIRFSNQNAQLQRAISTAQQESTVVEGKSRVVITAQQDGQATLVVAELGQWADGTKQLMSLIPADSGLEAKLYAPSSAIGFVRENDRVLLRYQPFPYQKFGLYEGKVKAISNASISNLELSGMAIEGLSATEPVYAITIKLDQQNVTTYGQQRPLQSGMRVEADILQENRKLYEWMLEPLYSVRGKVGA